MLCIPFAYAPDHVACGDANAVCAPPAVALANILGACPKAEKTVQTISFSLGWLSKKCDKLHHC